MKVSLGNVAAISVPEMGRFRSLCKYMIMTQMPVMPIHVGKSKHVGLEPEVHTVPEYSNWACISMTEIYRNLINYDG